MDDTWRWVSDPANQLRHDRDVLGPAADLEHRILFTTLGGIETSLLARAQRRLSVVRSSWLRRGYWPEAT